jgi:NADPH2:quinone reductase
MRTKAMVCHTFTDPPSLELGEVTLRAPGPGEIVVAVRAAGANYVDALICSGRYQLQPALPYVPGSEVAGEVVALGPGVVTRQLGDRVVALTGEGGYAEVVVVPEAAVLPLPGGLDEERAAVMLQSYGTALFTLDERCPVTRGEWVLVLGAGGGIGLACVDLALARGARVIAAASDDERLRAAAARGAEGLVRYDRDDLKDQARRISGGGVDVVVDPVGGAFSEPALRALRPFGRFCVVGFASGQIAKVPLNQVLLGNRQVVGVEWGSWVVANPDGNSQLLSRLVGMVGRGELHPAAPTRRPLPEAGQVLGEMLSRQVIGKVALVTRPEGA